MEVLLKECVRLLRRFGQIILKGPPGTGKTRAAKHIVAEMLGVDSEKIDAGEYQGDLWDIVQFHPSYGYEDFVRGVRVKTEKGDAVYETVDRHFGVMAKRALDNLDDKHFLIIDEINRANVAAVLGELIYGLEFEYRGKKIMTPYAVKDDDFSLVVPKNLFVIGTMNTADRTIGHIDYAVRRRFAFRTLLPDSAVVKDKKFSRAPSSLDLFDKVSALFDKKNGCMSDDFDAGDVAVGHSYFLAKDDGELRDKMIFQVVPILEEYLRDGVLEEKAGERINKIKEAAENLVGSPDLVGSTDSDSNQQPTITISSHPPARDDESRAMIPHTREITAALMRVLGKNPSGLLVREIYDQIPQLQLIKEYEPHLKDGCKHRIRSALDFLQRKKFVERDSSGRWKLTDIEERE